MNIRTFQSTFSRKQTHLLLSKFLKDNDKMREDCDLDFMTWNELKFYSKVIPCLREFLCEKSCDISTDWSPRFYYGFYGFDEGVKSLLFFIIK